MKLKLFLKEQKGATDIYLGLIFEFVIFMSLVFTLLSVYQPYVQKQKVDYIASKLIRAAEIEGEINSNVNTLSNQLQSEFGITPTITWNANYIGTSKKIQYRDTFSVTVSYTSKIKIMEPSFRDPVYINIPIQKKLTGISEVFWKT